MLKEREIKENSQLLTELRTLYRMYGYHSFRMSKFEKYELYAGNRDFLVSDRIISFHDTDGELLALKPDVTLSIVKSAQFQPRTKKKLYYQENVYRPAGGTGHFREIMQCGLECLGDLDAYDIFEVLNLAEQSLALLSPVSVLSVSHLGIVDGLFRALHADEEQQKRILDLLGSRNLHELRELFSKMHWDPLRLHEVEAMLNLSCGLAELPRQIEALCWVDPDVREELNMLAMLFRGEESRIRFDFSVSNDTHYYNGIVFQGFAEGIAGKLISGGRYDRLLARMGVQGSAIGFAVYFDPLDPLRRPEKTFDADVLLLYDEDTPLCLIRDSVRNLTAEGKSVLAQQSENGSFGMIKDLRGGKTDA